MPYKTITECANILAQNLFILERSYDHEEIINLADQLPACVHFNSRRNLINTYLSPNISEFVYIEAEQIVGMREQYFSHYVHPQTLVKIFPKFLMLNTTPDYSTIITETQMIKSGKEWNDVLTVTKKTPHKEDFISLSVSLNMIEKSLSLSNLLDDKEFIRKHYQIFQTLTAREKEILNLIANGFSNTQIGERLFISPHTVRTHRNNIWRKLSISSFKDVVNFQRNFLKDFQSKIDQKDL